MELIKKKIFVLENYNNLGQDYSWLFYTVKTQMLVQQK